MFITAKTESLRVTKLSLLIGIGSLVFAATGCAATTDEPTTADDSLVETTDSTIVGGQATNAYPAVGALVAHGEPFCTATVVAKRALVTAAHCLQDYPASSIRFVLGSNAFQPQARIAVRRIIPHPQYNPQQLTNDIGVVLLAQDAPVEPIALNDSMTAAWKGRSLTFVGFGATNGWTGAGVGTKRAVSIALAQIGGSQFAYIDRQKNTCYGDSGGPAFAQDESGALLLAGVTSYGDQTCTQFGVDTRVDAFKSFIAAAQQ